ncbi:MAG: hypothetical protein HY956_11630 [Deltaproteobacteria bacterium]|nr:hypothetical protein [Deltaproteobacteria bacterium]
MELAGKMFFIGGLAGVAVIQLYLVVKAFREKFIQGLLCLFVPGYILYYALKEKGRVRLLAGWALGTIALIAGAAMLS